MVSIQGYLEPHYIYCTDSLETQVKAILTAQMYHTCGALLYLVLIQGFSKISLFFVVSSTSTAFGKQKRVS